MSEVFNSSVLDAINRAVQDGISTTALEVDGTPQYCIINAETREIEIPGELNIFGVESDEKSTRVYFRCPKYVGTNVDLDMTQCIVYVPYRNANGEKDQYIVTDLNETEDGENVEFTWLISRKASAYMGITEFGIRAIKTATGGTIEAEWNTTVASANVIRGMDVGLLEFSEENKDALAQALDLINQELEQTKNEMNSEIETKGQQTLATIPEDYTELSQMVTEGNSELKDIRVGADGNVYDNAGDSVRTQVNKINGYLDDVVISDLEGNIFDKNKMLYDSDGHYYDSNGIYKTYPNYGYSKLLLAESDTTYFITSPCIINNMDANGDFIDGLTIYEGSFVTPSNTKYIRVSIDKQYNDIFMIVKNSLPGSYIPYKVIINDKVINKRLDNVEDIAEDTANDFHKIYVKDISNNIFDPSNFIYDNSYYDYHDGILKSYEGYGHADFIPCESETNYVANVPCQICFYDTNKSFLSGAGVSEYNYVFLTPSNCVYITCSVVAESIGSFMIYKGTVLPDDYISIDGRITVKTNLIGRKVVCIGDSQTAGIIPNGDKIDEGYPYYFQKYSGANVINLGRSGYDSILYWNGISNKNIKIDPDCDLALIMLGTNGGLTDTLDTDVNPYNDYKVFANTETGCYCKIIEYLYELTNKEIQIMLIKPIYNYYNEQKYEMLLTAINVIPKIAQKYHLPVIDCFEESGFNHITLSRYSDDLIHMNSGEGYRKLGLFIMNNVSSKLNS